MALASLDSPVARHLAPADSQPIPLDGRHILYVREGTLLVQAFDPDRGQVEGDATPVVDLIWFLRGTGSAEFTASADGQVRSGHHPHPRALSGWTAPAEKSERSRRQAPSTIRGCRPTGLVWLSRSPTRARAERTFGSRTSRAAGARASRSIPSTPRRRSGALTERGCCTPRPRSPKVPCSCGSSASMARAPIRVWCRRTACSFRRTGRPTASGSCSRTSLPPADRRGISGWCRLTATAPRNLSRPRRSAAPTAASPPMATLWPSFRTKPAGQRS